MWKLTSPCKNCPFRNDRPTFLRRDRARDIADSIEHQQLDFPCHETTNLSEEDGEETVGDENEQMCAGAIIIMEKMGRSTQNMRISERFPTDDGDNYCRDKMDMTAPVFENFDEFVAAQSLTGQPRDPKKALPPKRKSNKKR